MYADDIATLISGPGGAANTEANAVADSVVDKFENSLKMQISRGRKPWELSISSKSIALASSRIARARLEPNMRRIGIATLKWIENLGIDFQTAGRLVRTKQAERVRQTQAKMVGTSSWAREQAGTCSKMAAFPP